MGWDRDPRGLKGEEIPLAARIFAVADVFDAMASDRPYQLALPPQEAGSRGGGERRALRPARGRRPGASHGRWPGAAALRTEARGAAGRARVKGATAPTGRACIAVRSSGDSGVTSLG